MAILNEKRHAQEKDFDIKGGGEHFPEAHEESSGAYAMAQGS